MPTIILVVSFKKFSLKHLHVFWQITFLCVLLVSEILLDSFIKESVTLALLNVTECITWHEITQNVILHLFKFCH